MSEREIMELQSSIIEWQRVIIGDLMGRFSMEPQFCLPEQTQEIIREVNCMYRKLNPE